MKLSWLSLLLTAASLTSATQLFVSSYAGTVTTLSLTEKAGKYTLDQTFVSQDCAPNPSWLTLDANRGLLFCLNEGLETVNGSLSSFKVNIDGSLTHVQNTTTISGPVNGVIYGPAAGHRGLALAHYTGSAVTTWHLNGGGTFSLNQNIPYTLSQPGADPDRQEAPHEHEAILDPTGQYILVPDLGADLVRVFSYDVATLALKELDPLPTAPGEGPRHVAFYNPYGVACEGCTTYMYIANELASTVAGFSVAYKPNNAGLEFQRIYNSTTYAPLPRPAGTAPSEIFVSPDNRFLLIGNRNSSIASGLTVPNPNPSNTTRIPSDTISTFSLSTSGQLNLTQVAPAYGSFPRQFSINAIGDLVAVGLQYSAEVVVLKRDVVSGDLGGVVARIGIEGNVTCVVWNEEQSNSGGVGSLGV